MNRLLLSLSLVLLWVFGAAPFAASAATKTEQVEQYLGTQRFKRERPVGVVKFVFQRAVLKRQGDGKKTYEQLLISEPGFSNRDNAGRLVSIQIVRNGETIVVEPESARQARKKEQEAVTARAKEKAKAPAKHTNAAPPKAKAAERPSEAAPATRVRPERVQVASKGEAMPPPSTAVPKGGTTRVEPTPAAYSVPSAASALASDPVRPRQNIPPRPDAENRGISLPDSMTVVRNIEEAKEQITTWKGRMWQTIKPAWEFVMWIFSSLIIVLICLAGICRYVAKTAASESLISAYGRVIVGRWIVSAHQNAAAMLLVITWVIAIVLLIDVFMWLVYLNLPIWTLLVIWFPALWLAEKITSWLVPNIPIAGGPHH